MKRVIKIFLISLVIIMLITIGAFAVFKTVYTPSHLRANGSDNDIDDIVIELPVNDVIIEKTEEELWQDAMSESDRVNVLLFGTDGNRADTLIFLSYSKLMNDLTMVTIPRDTKNEVEGMTALGQNKINAVYCFPKGQGGAENQTIAIEKILGVPIHYYVNVSYNGLKAVVDTIGGVEVNVHRDMNYDDRWAVPELHIHLDAGTQVLNGDKAMQYIRWRKNNDGSGDSDLERGKRQQEFIVKVAKKSVGLNIVKVIGLCYDYVKTDMSKEDLLYYGSELIGFDFNDINRYSIPGEADMSFFYHDPIETKLLMQKIYGYK